MLRREGEVKIRLQDDRTRVLARTPFVFVGNNEYHVEGFKLGARTRLDAGRLSRVFRAAGAHARSAGAVCALAVRLRAPRARARIDGGTRAVGRHAATRIINVACDGEVLTLATPLHYRIVARRAGADSPPRADTMRTIVHLSDLHFGRVDERIIAPLLERIASIRPDLIAVSGDLTQRARRRQFQQASAFLARLPFPKVVVPGNHDVPLFNVAARLFDPFGGYRRWISPDLEPALHRRRSRDDRIEQRPRVDYGRPRPAEHGRRSTRRSRGCGSFRRSRSK